MQLATTAIVCAVRQHGENGAIARVLTVEAGLIAGYVRGGRSRRVRPVLIPGNSIVADFRSRTEDQLPALTVELLHSRGPLLGEPLAAAAIDWATTLTAIALPEGQAYPTVFSGLGGLLDAIELAPAASGWAGAVARYETLLLAQLGYAGDLAPTTDLHAALRRNRDAIYAHLLSGARARDVAGVRERLVDRLQRALG